MVLSVTGGSVLAAKTSDGYRNFSEQYIPGTASLHNLFLGPKQTKIDPPPMYAPIQVYSLYYLIYQNTLLGQLKMDS